MKHLKRYLKYYHIELKSVTLKPDLISISYYLNNIEILILLTYESKLNVCSKV